MEITGEWSKSEEVEADILVIGVMARTEKGEKGKEPGPARPYLDPDAAKLDKTMGGLMTDVFAHGELKPDNGHTLLLYTHGKAKARRLILVGLGKERTLESARTAAAAAAKAADAMGAKRLAFLLFPFNDPAGVAQAMVEGAILATHKLTAFKGALDKKEERNGRLSGHLSHIMITTSDRRKQKVVQAGAAKGAIIAQCQCDARDLANTPGASLTPIKFAEWALKVSKELGPKVTCTILDEKMLAKEGMSGTLEVGKGSINPPRFVIMDYKGGKKDDAPLVLVGKGITFDTGGISLKTNQLMMTMKYDMSGAAIVMNALRAIARLGLPLNVVALAPLAENMPSDRALKVEDIITYANGVTVEVVSTDAEGRLILADALLYASRFKPKGVIDVATLTGSTKVAVGRFAGCVLGNDKKMVAACLKAGTATHERVWELPLWPDFKDQMKSELADMKNGGGPDGGTVTAAIFLERFVDYPWAHLDIANVGWTDTARTYLPQGPSAWSMRLLVRVVRDITKK